ncbi:hypothetical protein ACTL6P_00110 [Endozoicomonas acroporae]|uniref:hypothetical protein n=1 Tax=Endozoicomonas acroporae TaxID=1701104 RepID=UPI000C75612A|nr:hypothetical protein [Endozoicomonas acroporae]
MLIEQEVSGDIEELTALFKQSPEKTEQAIQRTLSKLSRWAERQVLRDMSRRIKVSQKRLKELNRIKVRLNKSYGRKERYLTIWIGINEVGAHRLGNPRQTHRGVRVGSHSFWENSFLMQPVNASRELIFERKDNWQHRYQKSKRSGRWMWMGLPLEKKTVRIDREAETSLAKISPLLVNRFTDLLHQELNYAFNIES